MALGRRRQQALLTIGGFLFFYVLLTFSSLRSASKKFFFITNAMSQDLTLPEQQQQQVKETPRCALLFFGLPRSYEALALPSIVKNVLIPNLKYGCDVYAHAIVREKEEAGRSGNGGTIDLKAIYLLKQRVKDHYWSVGSREPHVVITTDTEQDFWVMRNETIQKFRTAKDAKGNLLYFAGKPYFRWEFPTSMDNAVRQWHSIESVWRLMEEESETLGVKYSRIAMLRSDVLFVTPIDIYDTFTDVNASVIPGFAMYPVNDRMIYGPYDAIKIWATGRFQRVDDHVLNKVSSGVGMHSERFLNKTIFPAMVKESGTRIVIHPGICFFRVRADMSVWINDCQPGKSTIGVVIPNRKDLVERIIGRKCYERVSDLICPLAAGEHSTDEIQIREDSNRPTSLLQHKAAHGHNSATTHVRVALYGPHDRFNFGDLLFEKVVQHLLIHRSNYDPGEIVSTGMLNINMSQYGGNAEIKSIKSVIAMSHDAVRSGRPPIDVIFLGGQSLGCSHACGVKMLATEELRQQARRENVWPDCAYLIPKEWLLPPEVATNESSVMPISIVNSVGMIKQQSTNDSKCLPAVETASFVAFRDLKPNTTHPVIRHAKGIPDCAVMVKELFDVHIADYALQGEVAMVHRQAAGNKYIAVQFKESPRMEPQKIANMLDEIWQATNMTIVFFRAGSVPMHDSLNKYSQVASLMQGPSIIYQEENVWGVVALISRAAAVLGTSLHVRIMSFIYEKPRVTLCSSPKHQAFIGIWDSPDSIPCLKFTDFEKVLPSLQIAVKTPINQTRASVQRAVRTYLDGYDVWSGLLHPRYLL